MSLLAARVPLRQVARSRAIVPARAMHAGVYKVCRELLIDSSCIMTRLPASSFRDQEQGWIRSQAGLVPPHGLQHPLHCRLLSIVSSTLGESFQ